ncbi:flagellar protein FlgN [Alkalibacillus almallahensis]|uniref:flagellar protein FlgN n=1 Tax=Alkalibacillus almallahensis TaxID=1379154 RepID=UPI001422B536|nr:flagellar protein FlgN [Alkalibacillus almallahensis]NIK12498.1 flagellar biosynthesis/type III secretory pathway chaperone [Alkalibacillus almallahensis]
MSIDAIIEKLEKIQQLNESLLQLSKDKTEQLKQNNLETFNQMLIKERKHAQALDQIETKRVEETEAWFQEKGISDERTISNLIQTVDDPEKKAYLEALYEKLVYTLADLKQQEQLNRDLTEQSLQYVELTLDMLQPKHQKDLNYHKQQQSNQSTDHSIFDSKA